MAKVDPEIAALEKVLRALEPLANDERWRIIEYARRRYETSPISVHEVKSNNISREKDHECG